MNIQTCLGQERAHTTFNVEKMSEFLYPPTLYNDLKEAFKNNPPPVYDFNLFNKGRVAILKDTYEKVPIIINNLTFDKQANVIDAIYGTVQQLPGSIHLSMFLKCIQIMGSEEQKKQYIEAGWRYDVIGCYAQTQIGHGSDVQSLQTTATFIEQTGEIQVHTPSISAAKYWPGDLGVMANHALVFAQLLIKGKKYGVHPFIVRIRDQNWDPMPGITAGDIGPKMAFYAKQNGFLLLDKVRIPRTNILAKFLSITKDGQLKRTGDPKISYATMMFIRQFISTTYPKVLGQAISIALRYSVFRKQFKNKAGQQIKVIEYQTQQDKLTTRVAEYFAMSIGGNVIRDICAENSKRVEQNHDLSLIGETHACLCLGKALYSEITYDGMEICRKACGGHGYSHYSGLPNLIGEYAANLTHQGQNTVLYLQIARYILKNYKKFMMNQPIQNENAKYIQSYEYFMQNKVSEQLTRPQNWTIQNIRKLLAQVVCCMVEKCTEKLMLKGSKQEFSNMNDMQFMSYFVGCNLQQLAKAHGLYFTYSHFVQAIMKQRHEQVKDVTTQLCKLFGVTYFLSYATPVIEKGIILPEHISALNELRYHLLKELRPNLIGLVDSFMIPDCRLRTHLAKGDPYENYLQMARKCEINQKVPQSALLVKNGIKKALSLHPQQARL